MTAPVQTALPFAPWIQEAGRRLPGTAPCAPDDWVRTDEAHGGQMALRDRLLATRRGDVLACLPRARGAADELLDAALDRLTRAPGYRAGAETVSRPDGVTVPVDRDDPMATLGRLVQEDLCLLERDAGEDEHVLTAAVLCFPAYWTLGEKIGRPLGALHGPVPSYAPVAHRVQRLFDGLQPGRPIRRANAHPHAHPDLFTPRREGDHPATVPDGAWLRSEVQVLFRLPRTRAVVFSIHTYMLRRSDLSPEAARALDAWLAARR